MNNYRLNDELHIWVNHCWGYICAYKENKGHIPFYRYAPYKEWVKFMKELGRDYPQFKLKYTLDKEIFKKMEKILLREGKIDINVFKKRNQNNR